MNLMGVRQIMTTAHRSTRVNGKVENAIQQLEAQLRNADLSQCTTYETDVAARKPRAEYTRGLTIVGEAWDYMGNLTEVVYSISSVY